MTINETSGSNVSLLANISTGGGMSTFPFPMDITIGLTVYATLLFILSLIGNILVIYIVCTRKHMRNSTNIMIVNMAIGDLLLTIDIPYIAKFLYVLDAWFGGQFVGSFFCKFFSSAQLGSIAASVFTLVVISFDRCCAILYPLRRACKGKVLKASIAGIWLASVAFSIPVIVVSDMKLLPRGRVCNEFWEDFPSMRQERFIAAFLVLTYVIPLVFIAVAYIITGFHLWTRKLPGNENLLAKQKMQASSKKATLMLITVVVVFAVCWMPLQIREVLKMHAPNLKIPLKFDILLPWFGITNVAINPMLYVIFSENYRREFFNILCCRKSEKVEMYRGLTNFPERTPLSTPLMDRKRRSEATVYGNNLSPSPDRRLSSMSERIQLKDIKSMNGT